MNAHGDVYLASTYVAILVVVDYILLELDFCLLVVRMNNYNINNYSNQL